MITKVILGQELMPEPHMQNQKKKTVGKAIPSKNTHKREVQIIKVRKEVESEDAQDQEARELRRG